MDLIKAAVLGLVEGVTEFLPISSTAHLLFVSKLLGIEQADFINFFVVFIQSGAIIAVFFMYLNYLLNHRDMQNKILVGFVPTATIGFLLFDIIKNIFFTAEQLIIGALAIVGLVFIVIEYLIRKNKIKLTKSVEQLPYHHAIIVGTVQSLAILPGVSRAGAVIIAMLLLGYKRKDAAVFSFLLAIPTILAAAFYDVYRTGPLLFLYSDKAQFLVVGFAVSFISAYFSVRWLIKYLQTHTLTAFGIYRIVLAIILVGLIVAR